MVLVSYSEQKMRSVDGGKVLHPNCLYIFTTMHDVGYQKTLNSTQTWVQKKKKTWLVSKQDPILMRKRRNGDNSGYGEYDIPDLAVSQ